VKILLLPAAVVLLSLAADPVWPLELLQRVLSAPPNNLGSISLYTAFGPAVFLLLLPPLLLPMKRGSRFLSLLAAIPLLLPYFQQADLLALFVFPFGPVVLLGNLGFAKVFGWSALRLAAQIAGMLLYLGTLRVPLLGLTQKHGSFKPQSRRRHQGMVSQPAQLEKTI